MLHTLRRNPGGNKGGQARGRWSAVHVPPVEQRAPFTQRLTHDTQEVDKKGKDTVEAENKKPLCLLKGWGKVCGIYLAVSSAGGAQLLFFQVSESLLWTLRRGQKRVKGAKGGGARKEQLGSC